MTKSVIKICNFVHYFFREGGYLYCDQFSLLFFSLFMVGGGGVQREIVPNSLYSWFFFDDFPYQISLYNELLYSNCVIEEVTINCQQFHELENSLRMPINELNNLAGSLRGLQKTHLEVVFEKKNHGKNLYCKRGY